MPIDDIKKMFSANLKQIMLDHSKTQSDLVKDLNLRQATVSDWLNGKKYPRMDKVELLAKYFNVSINDLIMVVPKFEYTMSPKEKMIIKKYRQLDAGGQDRIDRQIDFELFQLAQSAEAKEERLG